MVLVLVLVELLAQAAVSQTEGGGAISDGIESFLCYSQLLYCLQVDETCKQYMISSHNCTMFGQSQVETVGDMG